jgi:hypothetical protein
VKWSGLNDAYCASVSSCGGDRARRGDGSGGEKDTGSSSYGVGDAARGVYAVAEAGAGASGGRAVLGDCALVHSSSSASCDDVAAAAAEGEVYNAVGLNVGARGRGACRRGSEA